MSRSLHPTDLELLELRAEGAGDGLAGLRGIRILRSAATEAFCVGSEVPPELATTLEATWSCAAAASDPSAAPPALDACARLLIAERWNVERRAGIEYLIESEVRFESDAAIERSDRPTPEWMRDAACTKSCTMAGCRGAGIPSSGTSSSTDAWALGRWRLTVDASSRSATRRSP